MITIGSLGWNTRDRVTFFLNIYFSYMNSYMLNSYKDNYHVDGNLVSNCTNLCRSKWQWYMVCRLNSCKRNYWYLYIWINVDNLQRIYLTKVITPTYFRTKQKHHADGMICIARTIYLWKKYGIYPYQKWYWLVHILIYYPSFLYKPIQVFNLKHK